MNAASIDEVDALTALGVVAALLQGQIENGRVSGRELTIVAGLAVMWLFTKTMRRAGADG